MSTLHLVLAASIDSAEQTASDQNVPDGWLWPVDDDDMRRIYRHVRAGQPVKLHEAALEEWQWHPRLDEVQQVIGRARVGSYWERLDRAYHRHHPDPKRRRIAAWALYETPKPSVPVKPNLPRGRRRKAGAR